MPYGWVRDGLVWRYEGNLDEDYALEHEAAARAEYDGPATLAKPCTDCGCGLVPARLWERMSPESRVAAREDGRNKNGCRGRCAGCDWRWRQGLPTKLEKAAAA